MLSKSRAVMEAWARDQHFGGDAGGISDISATITESARLFAGDGGRVGYDFRAVGGKAGDVSAVTLAESDASGPDQGADVYIAGGKWGGTSAIGVPNTGGNAFGIKLSSGQFSEIELHGGEGADGSLYHLNAFESEVTPGGTGGSLSNITMEEAASAQILALYGGNGGGYGAAGASCLEIPSGFWARFQHSHCTEEMEREGRRLAMAAPLLLTVL